MMKPDTPKFALVPCPFCGGIDLREIQHDFGVDDTPIQYAIGCNNCLAEIAPCQTREESLKAWNTRAMISAAPKLEPLKLSAEEWEGLMKALDAPPKDNPGLRRLLAAAPKPDCVGVEEIRNSVYKMAFGGNIDADSDGDYIHVIDEVIDALKTLGLLAVKEKAQERGEHPEPFQDEENKGGRS